MGLIVITAPTVEPITLAEACAQVRQDVGVDDAAIGICIAGARAKAEGLMQRPLIVRTLEESFDAFPDAGAEIRFSSTPVQSLTSIKYTNTAGTETTLSPSAYTLDATSGLQPRIVPIINTTWPDTEASINAVRVRYVAGLAPTAADVPADVKSWLLLTIGYLYAQREAIDSTGKAVEIPGRFVDSLLDPWRAFAC